jgi:hypothetical protein
MFVKLENNKPVLFIAKSKNRSSENSLCGFLKIENNDYY